MVHFLHYVFGVFGARAFQKKDAGLVPGAHQFLERSERHKKTRALPMLDDSRNMPIVLENSIRLSRLYLFHLRCNVVHKNVVRTFKIVPLKEYKSAGDGPKAFRINSINDFHARSVELEKHGGHGLDVLHFGEFIADFYGHRRAAKRQKVRSIRRLQHDICPDAFNAFSSFG